MTEYLSCLFPRLSAVAGDRGIRRRVGASVSGSKAPPSQTEWDDENFESRRRKTQGQHGNKLLQYICFSILEKEGKGGCLD